MRSLGHIDTSTLVHAALSTSIRYFLYSVFEELLSKGITEITQVNLHKYIIDLPPEYDKFKHKTPEAYTRYLLNMEKAGIITLEEYPIRKIKIKNRVELKIVPI